MVNGYKVEIMPGADEDLHVIYDYIEKELESKDNAEHTLDYIKETRLLIYNGQCLTGSALPFS